ncbi:MAG: hypothetical protein ACJ72N_28525 [Labedaea sp.]
MRRVGGLLVVTVLAVLVLMPTAAVSASAARPAAPPSAVHAVALDQPTATPNPSAPAGPALNPEQQPNKAKHKLTIGVLAAILLVIVIFGRSTRRKRKKKSESATSK